MCYIVHVLIVVLFFDSPPCPHPLKNDNLISAYLNLAMFLNVHKWNENIDNHLGYMMDISWQTNGNLMTTYNGKRQHSTTKQMVT